MTGSMLSGTLTVTAARGLLQLKRGASFDYEAKADPNYKAGTLTVTITATDGGGLSTTAHFSVKISDVAEETPPPTPSRTGA